VTQISNSFIHENRVPECADKYPTSEMFQYWDHVENGGYHLCLPSYGIYFRHVYGLVMENVVVNTYRADERPCIIYCDVVLDPLAPAISLLLSD
jgi:hypothetical protein